MNAAILNADLPMSIRMKRANRRGWMLDRRDNIKFLVQGMQAYRQLAAPLLWEGTFEQNRNQPAPFTTFGQQSIDLEYEALASRGFGKTFVTTLIAMVAGNIVIYGCGAIWLAQFIGTESAVNNGVLPFLYGDILKILIAAALLPAAWRILSKFK